jgi:hypothetical protein
LSTTGEGPAQELNSGTGRQPRAAQSSAKASASAPGRSSTSAAPPGSGAFGRVRSRASCQASWAAPVIGPSAENRTGLAHGDQGAPSGAQAWKSSTGFEGVLESVSEGAFMS